MNRRNAPLSAVWALFALAAVSVAVGSLVVTGLDAAEAGRPAQEGSRGGRRLPEDVELLRDIVYGKGGDRDLRLDLLRPKAPPAGPMPVLVYVHGGAWRAGSKDNMPPLCLRLVRSGYVCASVEYRLSQEAIYPAQIEDCKCAIRFLRAHAAQYHIDPDRIGAWGHSAGGHLVALLGTTGDVKALEGQGGWAEQSGRVQAVVDCFGPTDFRKMVEGIKALGQPDRMGHDSPTSPESLLIGAPIQESPEKVARANPITYVTQDDPPFLIMHGSRDTTVPPNQSELLHAALKRAGVETTLHVVEGAGHGFGGPKVDGAIEAFLDKHLKGKAADTRK